MSAYLMYVCSYFNMCGGHVCIYACACACRCTCVCMYMYLCTSCVGIHVYLYMRVRAHVHVLLRVYTHMLTCCDDVMIVTIFSPVRARKMKGRVGPVPRPVPPPGRPSGAVPR